MLFILHFAFCIFSSAQVLAQQSKVFCENVRSLQVMVNDDPLAPPIIDMGKGQQLTIEFDEMSHDYHRFTYHIQHCNADWTETEGLFESDFLSGFNDQPIEDYENSFNTTQLYTHYRLTLPNSETRLHLSGNYRVTIYEDDDKEEPLLQAEFCMAEATGMSIMAEVSGNTDIDFNQEHQQLSYQVSYGKNRVVDPLREIHTVVMQNRRQDNRVVDLEPNIQHANGIGFTHRKELIFPAGNEFRKFEILDVQKPGLNVDNMRWYEPFYHATLYADRPIRNYEYDEDQNGGFVMRNDDGNDDTESEYIWVHFTLIPRDFKAYDGNDVYVWGQWSNGFPDPACRMTWNEETKAYEAAVYLKQGYYNYMYLLDNGENVDRNSHETENEYIILVYHRPQGGRYDRLAGYRVMKTNL